MEYNLICVHPFAHYTKGQRISDQDEVKKLLIENEQNFVRVSAVVPAQNEFPSGKIAPASASYDAAPRSENKNSRKG